MNVLLPFLLAAGLAPGVESTDTLLVLRQGDRVVVENVSGELRFEAWSRAEMEVAGEDGDVVSVSRSGGRLVLRPSGRRGRRTVDLVLRLPSWAGVEVGGASVDVSIRGMRAGATVQVVEGDIEVAQGEGSFDLSTVEGEVTVEHVRGSVRAHAQADDVWVGDVAGDVRATTGSGDIDLVNIDGAGIFAETVDGDVTFQGALQAGGSYEFSVHEGDADVTVQPDLNARVSISTFDGDFRSDFPVRLERYQNGRTFDFTVGGGGARLSIEVFDGSIRLREAGRSKRDGEGIDAITGESR